MQKELLGNISLILPQNDLESCTIGKLAENFRLADILCSCQTWGARLESEPAGTLEGLRKEVWRVEMPGPQLEKRLEFNGHAFTLINQHTYSGLDRANNLSSLGPFAEKCGYTMSPDEKVVAVNDRAYIWGLIAASENFKSIRAIRKRYLVAQKYTENDIQNCRRAYDLITASLYYLWENERPVPFTALNGWPDRGIRQWQGIIPGGDPC